MTIKKGLIYNKQDNTMIIGKVFNDGSFGEYIQLYVDETNTFQIRFLKGGDLAYTFLPKCTELLDLLEEGMIGVSMKQINKHLIEQGYQAI